MIEEDSQTENRTLLGISPHHHTFFSTVYLSELRILLKITVGIVQKLRMILISLGVGCRGIALV